MKKENMFSKSKEEISEDILKIAKRVLQERGITGNLDLMNPLNEEGLGLDSIGRLNLLAEIEKETRVELPEECWGSRTFDNLFSIIQFIYESRRITKSEY